MSFTPTLTNVYLHVSRHLWLCAFFFFLCVCVRLCARTCWSAADYNTRSRVCLWISEQGRFPPCSTCLHSCMFLGLHAWLCQLFYSLAWPSQPDPAFSPRRPLLPSEVCSSSDKGHTGQMLGRAPHGPLRACAYEQCTFLRFHTHTICMWKHIVLSPVHRSFGSTAKVRVRVYSLAERRWPWDNCMNEREYWKEALVSIVGGEFIRYTCTIRCLIQEL